MDYVRVLYKTLAVVSLGFYVHPSACAFECPGHPKDAEEIQRENREYQRNQDPARHLGDENQREEYEKSTRDGSGGGWANKD